MFALLVVLGAATIAIGGLCYVWMQSNRASQRRVDEFNTKVLALLEEQNALLREMGREERVSKIPQAPDSSS